MTTLPCFAPACVWDSACELGEGPVWDAGLGALWFVDIKRRELLAFGPGDARTRWAAPDQPGFALPAADGGLVVGMPDGLHRFDPATGRFQRLATVETDRPGNRLNDASVAPDGSLWFGSMDDGEAAPTGALYSWREGGLACHDDGVAITNGPAMSPDSRTFYHTETLARTVFAFDHAGGALRNKRALIVIEKGAGWPDGTTVDAEGCLWVCLWGGWSARRYAPTGELLANVRFPVANITKMAFGGPDLRTAYATTAAKGLGTAERTAQPLAGGLFAWSADVPGLSQARAQL